MVGAASVCVSLLLLLYARPSSPLLVRMKDGEDRLMQHIVAQFGPQKYDVSGEIALPEATYGCNYNENVLNGPRLNGSVHLIKRWDSLIYLFSR